VFSGIQPTGNLHLGNYLGAIKNWVALQEKYRSIFCIVDMHAITVPQEPAELARNIRLTAATYIACGIDAEKNIIFPQSAVAGHAELGWILGCITPLGWLNRMTQFKEKAGEEREGASLGLYGYPALMAADILLYKTTHVPVGEDQKQHLELARDIAGAFNRQFGEFFPIPEPMITGPATRVMSLRDGLRKMSKSDESDYSRINLTDDADTIALKIQKAKSDSERDVTANLENRPEAANLLNIYAALTGNPANGNWRGFGDFKKDLAAVAISVIEPIAVEIRKLTKDTSYLDSILKKGSERANEIAEKNMKEIKKLVGFPVF